MQPKTEARTHSLFSLKAINKTVEINSIHSHRYENNSLYMFWYDNA